MTRLFFLIFWLASALAVSASEVTVNEVDTLFYTSKASSIRIETSPGKIVLVVKNVDDTGDNYFYVSDSDCNLPINSRYMTEGNYTVEGNYITYDESFRIQEESIRINEKSYRTYKDIRDVIISEVAGKQLNVTFSCSGSGKLSFQYDIPNPDNRDLSTYLGRKGSDFGLSLKRSGKTEWTLMSGGIGFGWVSPLSAPQGMDVSMWKSNELTWAIVLGVKMYHGRHSFATGLGIDWRNYVTKGDRYFHKGEDGVISMLPYEENTTNHRSRIKTFTLQIPIMYGISFGHRRYFGLELGPVVCFNTNGGIKTDYSLGSRDYSIKTHRIHQRPVTFDVMGVIKYREIGLYVRYSPMNVLRDMAGFDFKSISTGVMIGF